MKVKETPTGQLYVDHYNQEDLQHIIDTQHQVVIHITKQNLHNLYSVLIIIDGFSDDPAFSRHSKLLCS